MKTSRILTIQHLIEAGACTDQVKLFRKTFGSRARAAIAKATSQE